MFDDIIFTMPYYCHCVGLEIAAYLYHQNGVTNNNNVLSHFGKVVYQQQTKESASFWICSWEMPYCVSKLRRFGKINYKTTC